MPAACPAARVSPRASQARVAVEAGAITWIWLVRSGPIDTKARYRKASPMVRPITPEAAGQAMAGKWGTATAAA
jgi:hypothetical protein